MEPNKSEIGEIFYAMALAGVANNTHLLGPEKSDEFATKIAETSIENIKQREGESEVTFDKRLIFYALFLTGCSAQVQAIGVKGVIDRCTQLSDLAIKRCPAKEGEVEV